MAGTFFPGTLCLEFLFRTMTLPFKIPAFSSADELAQLFSVLIFGTN